MADRFDEIGTLFLQRRKELGLTQEQLGEKVGDAEFDTIMLLNLLLYSHLDIFAYSSFASFSKLGNLKVMGLKGYKVIRPDTRIYR